MFFAMRLLFARTFYSGDGLTKAADFNPSRATVISVGHGPFGGFGTAQLRQSRVL